MNPERHQSTQVESQDPNQEAIEALAERLSLKEQYLAQVKVLYQSGILENFAVDPSQDRYAPEMGITGINGEQYIMPSYEDILIRLQNPEKRARLEKKIDQGFTQLQLVPFALPLSVLFNRLREVLLKVNKETGIKSTNGTKLELNTDAPLYVWDQLVQGDNPDSKDKQIEYGVTNYDGKTKAERGGKFKNELLANPDNAWELSLIEANLDIPAEGKGKTIAGRKQLEANKSPKDYLKFFAADPSDQQYQEYRGENGQTPEGAAYEAIAALLQRQTAINDWEGSGKINFCVGSYVFGLVPFLGWGRYDRRPGVRGDVLDSRRDYCGCRPAARF